MTKEELKQEAEEWLNKWELCNKCGNKEDCISNFSYCKKVVLQAYQKSAEPREKRNTELQEEIHTWKEASSTNSYKAFQFEKENKELAEENAELRNQLGIVKQKDKEVWKGVVDKSKLIKKNLELHIQLIKAKDLLNEFMRISVASVDEYEPEFSELIGKAEQFLNSEVEK